MLGVLFIGDESPAILLARIQLEYQWLRRSNSPSKFGYHLQLVSGGVFKENKARIGLFAGRKG